MERLIQLRLRLRRWVKPQAQSQHRSPERTQHRPPNLISLQREGTGEAPHQMRRAQHCHSNGMLRNAGWSTLHPQPRPDICNFFCATPTAPQK